MTTKTVSIRELLRNSKLLDDYDFVEVVNKKTHEYKGVYVSAKYAAEFKEYLESRKKQQIAEKLNRIKKFAGKGKIDKSFDGLSSSRIREKLAKENHGE